MVIFADTLLKRRGAILYIAQAASVYNIFLDSVASSQFSPSAGHPIYYNVYFSNRDPHVWTISIHRPPRQLLPRTRNRMHHLLQRHNSWFRATGCDPGDSRPRKQHPRYIANINHSAWRVSTRFSREVSCKVASRSNESFSSWQLSHVSQDAHLQSDFATTNCWPTTAHRKRRKRPNNGGKKSKGHREYSSSDTKRGGYEWITVNTFW